MKISKRPLTNLVALTFSANAGSALNFISQSYTAHHLTPDRYGALQSLLAFLAALYIPFSVVPFISSKLSVHASDCHRDLGAFLNFLVLSSLIWLGVLAFSFHFLASSTLKESTPLLLAIFSLLGVTVLNFYIGILQGRELMHYLGYKDICLAGLKLAFIWIGFQHFSSIVVPIAAEMFAVFLVAFLLKSRIGSIQIPRKLIDWEFLIKFRFFILNTLVGVGMLTLLNTFDILAAHYVLSSSDSGYFTAAGTLCKIVIFACAAITTILYSRAINEKSNILAFKGLVRSLVLSALFSLCVLVTIFLLRERLVMMIFGERYFRTIDLVPMFLIYTFFCNLILQLINFAIAREQKSALITIVLCYSVFSIALSTGLVQSVQGLIIGLGLTGLIAFSFSLSWMIFQMRKEKRG